jgi:hypothetical protein
LSGGGRGRGRGIGILGKGRTSGNAPPPSSLAMSLPSSTGASSPRGVPSPRGSSNDDDTAEKLAYLEGLVPSLNARIAAFERQVESLTAEREELRLQLERATANGGGTVKTSPGRESASAVLSSSPTASTPIPVSSSAALDAEAHASLQRRPSQQWIGTVGRRTATVSGGPAPMSTSSSALPTVVARAPVVPLLGGRRKELVDERGKAVERLIDSERKYNQRLNVLVSMYLEPVRHSLGANEEGTEDTIYDIFANSDVVLAVQRLFLAELLNCWSRWSSTSCIGDLIAKFIPLFSVYIEFNRSSCGAGPLELDAGRSGSLVRKILAQADAKSGEVGGLPAIFSAMRNRIREYMGTLIFVAKATDSSHPDFATLTQARASLEALWKRIERTSSTALSSEEARKMSVSADDLDTSSLSSSPPGFRLRSSSKTDIKPPEKSSKKTKATFTKSQSNRFKDKKERNAYEIQQRILADIQERERDPALSEEDRGRLKLQAAFAAQGKFEQALQVMAGQYVGSTPASPPPSHAPIGGSASAGAAAGGGVGGSGSAGSNIVAQQSSASVSSSAANSSSASEAVAPLTAQLAVEKLLGDAADVEFEKYFLGMYFYFVSWRDLFRLLKKAYAALSDSAADAPRRGRIMHVMSVWLELNPHLRRMVEDDGPKKKKSAAVPAPAPATVDSKQQMSPPLPTRQPDRLTSPPNVPKQEERRAPKPLPVPPPEPASPRTVSEKRVPDQTDLEIVSICNEIVSALELLTVGLRSKSDSECLKETRQVTQVALRLIDVLVSKEESEPEFVDMGQLLRGNVVSLTQSIVSVIKASFNEEASRTAFERIDEVQSRCDDFCGLAMSTTRVVEQQITSPRSEQGEGLSLEETDSGNKRESTSIIQSLLHGGGDDELGKEDQMQIYQAAMNTNAVFNKEENEQQVAAAVVVAEVVDGLAGRSFVDVVKEFLAGLWPRPAEQAFAAFFQAWVSMGTADENFRKAAYRKSVNLTKSAFGPGKGIAAGGSGGGGAGMDLLRELTPVKLAQQMAILEYSLFQVIPSEELFLSRFMDPQKAPNFSVLVTQVTFLLFF